MAAGWIADLLGKTIMIGGVTTLPDRKILNFPQGAQATDNPALGATDVSLGASGLSGSGATLLTTADNGGTLVNTGAMIWTLPAAALGLYFRAINANAAGTTLRAAGTDIIEMITLASTAGGTISATDVYASLLIAAISGKWVVIGQPLGTWTPA